MIFHGLILPILSVQADELAHFVLFHDCWVYFWPKTQGIQSKTILLCNWIWVKSIKFHHWTGSIFKTTGPLCGSHHWNVCLYWKMSCHHHISTSNAQKMHDGGNPCIYAGRWHQNESQCYAAVFKGLFVKGGRQTRTHISLFPFSGTTCFTVSFLLREVFVQVLENFSSTAGFTRSQRQT